MMDEFESQLALALKAAPEDQRLIYSIKKAENAVKGG